MDKKAYLEQVENGIVKHDEEKLAEALEDLRRHENAARRYEKKLELLNRELEIKLRGMKMIDPKYEFEKEDTYWEVQKEYLQLNVENAIMEESDTLKNLRRVIGIKREAYEKMKEEMQDE